MLQHVSRQFIKREHIVRRLNKLQLTSSIAVTRYLGHVLTKVSISLFRFAIYSLDTMQCTFTIRNATFECYKNTILFNNDME